MAIKIQWDVTAIAKLERAAATAAEKAVDALQTEVVSAEVMPFDNGDMQNTQTFTEVRQEEGAAVAQLVTGAPQARRLYYHPEYNFQKVNNKNARGEWLEPWIDGDRKDFLETVFRQSYREEAGL